MKKGEKSTPTLFPEALSKMKRDCQAKDSCLEVLQLSKSSKCGIRLVISGTLPCLFAPLRFYKRKLFGCRLNVFALTTCILAMTNAMITNSRYETQFFAYDAVKNFFLLEMAQSPQHPSAFCAITQLKHPQINAIASCTKYIDRNVYSIMPNNQL